MGKKQIRARIFSMILPIIIENILQMAAGIVSMAMIGRINVLAVAAQGVCARIVGIIWCLFKGISIGATVFIARDYGAGDYDHLKKVSQQTLLSSVILVLVFQQLIFWNAQSILSIFKPTKEVMENAIIYLKILSLGLPFVVIMIVVTGILQGMGNAKTPMIVALIMNITNIILSYILIFGNFGVPPLGIKGAAISIIAAQFVGAVIGIYILFSKDGVLNSLFNKEFFRFDFKEIKNIYKVGIPSSLESMYWEIAAIILSRVILSFGEVPFAAHQMGLQAESISEMPALGFGVAATTFIGQTFGSGDKELGKKYLDEITKGALLIISVGVFILLFLPHQAMRLLTDNEEVIKLGAIYLRLMGLVQVPQNLSRVYNGALKGAGYTRIPMMVALVGLWGIRIPASLILTHFFSVSIIAIWVVIAIDQTFRFVLSYALYKSKNIFVKGSAFENKACNDKTESASI